MLGTACDDSDNATTPAAPVAGTIYTFQTAMTYDPPAVKALPDRNAVCQASFTSYSPTVTCSTFHALLGHSSTNGLQNFISHHGLNGASAVQLVDGSEISSSFSDFLQNGPPALNGATWAGWSEGYWYSGVNADRSLGDTNCDDWTDDTSSKHYRAGTNSTTSSWDSRGQSCDYYDDYKFICICY